MNDIYDVALWRWPSSLFPERIGYVQAGDGFSAMCLLMRRSGWEEVTHAAARAVGCPGIECWDYLFVPLVGEEEVTI